MDTILERLQQLQQVMGLSVRGMALKINVKPQTLDNQIKGKRAVSIDTIVATALSFEEISCDWLLTGRGNMFVQNAENVNVYSHSNVATNGSKIDSHNIGADNILAKENEELRAENKALRERCDKLTDKLLGL